MMTIINHQESSTLFFELMKETREYVWTGQPHCPNRDVTFIETRTVIVEELEPGIIWEVRFPYLAIEKGKKKEATVTYRQHINDDVTRVFGEFSNGFHPIEDNPLYVVIDFRILNQCCCVIRFTNELPNAQARETHWYYLDSRLQIIERQRKSDFFSYKTKKWTTSLRGTDYITKQ